MSTKRLTLVVAALAVLGASVAIGTNLGGVAGAHDPAGVETTHPRPPWIGPDGHVDRAGIPAWMPVWGIGNDPVGWVKGEDNFATDDRPVWVYDKPNGQRIGRLDQ